MSPDSYTMTTRSSSSTPKKTAPKSRTTQAKKTSKHTIEVSQHTYQALEHLKTMFAAMATNEHDISLDDVINVLVQGFAESLEQDEGCCGGWCGCDHNHHH